MVSGAKVEWCKGFPPSGRYQMRIIPMEDGRWFWFVCELTKQRQMDVLWHGQADDPEAAVEAASRIIVIPPPHQIVIAVWIPRDLPPGHDS